MHGVGARQFVARCWRTVAACWRVSVAPAGTGSPSQGRLYRPVPAAIAAGPLRAPSSGCSSGGDATLCKGVEPLLAAPAGSGALHRLVPASAVWSVRLLTGSPTPTSWMTSPRLARAAKRFMSNMSQSVTPLEDALRAKITSALSPVALQVYNDSHKHSHHQAMQGVTSKETHFRVFIVSSAFQGKMQLARHRMINALLKEEMSREGGIHALQLTTRTPEEEASRQ